LPNADICWINFNYVDSLNRRPSKRNRRNRKKAFSLIFEAATAVSVMISMFAQEIYQNMSGRGRE